MAHDPAGSPGPQLRWPVVLAVAVAFGLALWTFGSGAKTTREPEEIPPDPEVTTSLASSDTADPSSQGTDPEGEGEVEDASRPEPNPIPQGPLRLRAALNRVRGVAAAPDGSLWAATDGGVIHWDPATGAAVVFESGQELPDTGVAGVVIGADGTVWTGSPGWIGHWKGAWTRFATPEGFERPLAVGPDGVVWWGSSDGRSIGWFDGAKWEVFEDVVPLGSGSMAVAPDGTVWAAAASADHTQGGVAEYDGSVWARHGVDQGLPDLVGASVTVTPDGTPWAGSMGAAGRQPGGGVARYDGSRWSVYTEDDGLISNGAGVASGPDGTVWAVAPQGLSRFDGSEWVSFPAAVGFGWGAVVDRNGVLWAPDAGPAGGLRGFDGVTTRRLVVGPEAAVGADSGAEPDPPTAEAGPPDDARLDFLATLCNGVGEDVCYRDGHFLDPQDATQGAGVWAAGLPFHIRHGFVNRGDDPLGDGFGIVVSVTRRTGPELEDGAFALDLTYRYQSDYSVRGMALKCGPGYWEQTDPQPCEWFVHDFPDGLPPGRYDIWVEWQAPCSAWLGLGLADVCHEPDEVTTLFASSVNMPFYGPGFWESVAEPFDPYRYPDSVTLGAATW